MKLAILYQAVLLLLTQDHLEKTAVDRWTHDDVVAAGLAKPICGGLCPKISQQTGMASSNLAAVRPQS